MKKFLILFLLFCNFAYASHEDHNHSHDHQHEGKQEKGKLLIGDCSDRINIDVNGLVCDFCARAVEKVFSKREEVSSIRVDLDEGRIEIAMNKGESISDNELKKLITDSGYDVVEINQGCDE